MNNNKNCAKEAILTDHGKNAGISIPGVFFQTYCHVSIGIVVVFNLFS